MSYAHNGWNAQGIQGSVVIPSQHVVYGVGSCCVTNLPLYQPGSLQRTPCGTEVVKSDPESMFCVEGKSRGISWYS